VADFAGREVVEPGYRRRGADGSPGAVGMDVGSRLRRAAQPRADLVAHHEDLEEPAAAGADFLSDGERSGDDMDGRMAPAEPIAFVHLKGDAGGRVGEG